LRITAAVGKNIKETNKANERIHDKQKKKKAETAGVNAGQSIAFSSHRERRSKPVDIAGQDKHDLVTRAMYVIGPVRQCTVLIRTITR